jgi:hypothetical protein
LVEGSWIEARPEHADLLSQFTCTKTKGKIRKYYNLWNPEPPDIWAVEVQGKVRKLRLPRPPDERVQLKIVKESVSAVLIYRLDPLVDRIANVDLVMLARDVSCVGEGLGSELMERFWSCVATDLSALEADWVEVKAIVRPANYPSKILLATNDFEMREEEDFEGFETWGVKRPINRADPGRDDSIDQ